MNIQEILNNFEEFENYKIELNYAKLLKNNFLEVVFNVLETPDENICNQIFEIINKELDGEYTLEIKYNKKQIDENTIINKIKTYLLSKSLYALNIKVDKKILIINLPKNCENLINEETIKDFISSEFGLNYDIILNFEEENDFEYSKQLQNEIIENNVRIMNKPKTIYISNIENIYGKIDILETNSIKGVKFKESTVYVCGKIAFLTEQRTKDKEEDGNIIEGKRYLSFSLNDGTGFIKCSIFENSKNEVIFESLQNDMNVVCCGKLREYNNNISLNVFEIAKCEFNFKENELLSFPEPKYYYTVKPEQYFETNQLSLFEIQKEEIVGEFLKDKNFVVFDFETTGFDAESDAVTELGAVKIRNGKIVETFSTFVNPQMPIPEQITQLTHITDEMVKDAPLIKDVVVDFYKFCFDSAIVAHNIEFDYKFLSYNANKYGIKFNNQQFDTLQLSRTYIKGLKNYKLGTICESLGIDLTGAHRAVNDCLATAKLFIKLTDYIK